MIKLPINHAIIYTTETKAAADATIFDACSMHLKSYTLSGFLVVELLALGGLWLYLVAVTFWQVSYKTVGASSGPSKDLPQQ